MRFVLFVPSKSSDLCFGCYENHETVPFHLRPVTEFFDWVQLVVYRQLILLVETVVWFIWEEKTKNLKANLEWLGPVGSHHTAIKHCVPYDQDNR